MAGYEATKLICSPCNTNTAFVTEEAGVKVVEKEVPRQPCGPADVVVEIQYSGLCKSDHAMMTNAWGMSQFPLVCGHEGIGHIVEVGANVSSRKVGDTVGIGWMRNTCLECRHCLGAKENLCDGMMAGAVTPFFNQNGTFAKYCVSPAKFAIPIPAGLDPKGAAPLMCAGITVWNPLVSNATHMSKVGINGIGGLGHLAVRFAAKMGMEVVAMSRGMEKKDKALALGATSYVDTKDQAQVDAHAASFDFILDTTPVTPDMSVWVKLLRGDGTFDKVGVPADGKKMEVACMPDMLPKSLSIGGSAFGSLSQLSDMMIFCARHNIVADYEVMPMSKLKEGLEKLAAGEGAQRIVLSRE